MTNYDISILDLGREPFDAVSAALENAYRLLLAEKAREKAENAPSPAAKAPAKAFVRTPAPVKALFNVKTEEKVPVLDDDGNPLYEQSPGENSPKRVVKRAKTLERPILASKVFFEDGTWTVVKNSGEDLIDLVEVEMPDGSRVKTASDASKEKAVVYAFFKRAFGDVDPATGEASGANLGRRLGRIIAASDDRAVSAARAKIDRAKSRAKPKTKGKEDRKSEGARPKTGKDYSAEDAAAIIAGLAKKLGLLGEPGEKP